MPVVPKGHHRLFFRDLSLTVYSRMESAKWKDCAQRDRSYVVRLLLCLLMSPNYPGVVDEYGPTMTINFILQSPLQAPHDPEVLTVSHEHRFVRGLYLIVMLSMHQSGSVPVLPFRRSFGILAVTMTVDALPLSKTLTSIWVSLKTRAHIRLSFSTIHFKI